MIDFLGIGAQKAATTWLFLQLERHPQVRFPAGKEVHFFDQQRERGLEWWLSLFPDAPEGIRQGEITPAYALLDPDDIGRLRSACPELRLFYCLRNPIERAWSSALMALERAELEEQEASDPWFIDHFTSRGSLARGDYSGCLQRFWSEFPKEQLLVLFYDDVLKEPRHLLGDLARHLGVDPGFYEALPEQALQERVRAGPDVGIRPSLLPVLHDLYDGRIESLASLVGRELNHWRSGVG
jgi:hypothetical protein